MIVWYKTIASLPFLSVLFVACCQVTDRTHVDLVYRSPSGNVCPQSCVLCLDLQSSRTSRVILVDMFLLMGNNSVFVFIEVKKYKCLYLNV